ncbi:MAG: flagellar export chaperone FliS [Candidatus Riflebacteria bacterium]|nr:flagellar export chaperone FliS [Candidatus Riflebacteria bacterium]
MAKPPPGALGTYRTMQVSAASPVQILVQLYLGAIQFLRDAEAALQENRSDEARQKIVRTQNILYELIRSLNFSFDSELPHDLHQLYKYMLLRLKFAGDEQHPEAISEVSSILRQLLGGWRQILSSPIPVIANKTLRK